jgi:hypothetical protein
MIWLVVAIVGGLVLGKFMGFMAVEFVMRPVMLIARGVAALLGTIVAWGRRLP